MIWKDFQEEHAWKIVNNEETCIKLLGKHTVGNDIPFVKGICHILCIPWR